MSYCMHFHQLTSFVGDGVGYYITESNEPGLPKTKTICMLLDAIFVNYFTRIVWKEHEVEQ